MRDVSFGDIFLALFLFSLEKYSAVSMTYFLKDPLRDRGTFEKYQKSS
jgi:hypothetical protein